MSPDQQPRSLEERVTRLETRAEDRDGYWAVVLSAMVAGALIVWVLFQYGLLKVTAGNPLG